MNHYLVIFDRRTGSIIGRSEYSSSTEAIEARFTAETKYRGRPDVAIVVSGSTSWESLRQTHGRYFQSVRELADGALAGLKRLVAAEDAVALQGKG